MSWKSVTSKDSRKVWAVAALKASRPGVNKVTNVELNTDTGEVRGHLLHKLDTSSRYQSLGFWMVKANGATGEVTTVATQPDSMGFDKALTMWLVDANAIVYDGTDHGSWLMPYDGEGHKYVKVLITPNTSVYAFVERKTGNIYKPSTWRGPELNHVRGNIYDPATRLLWVGRYGIKCIGRNGQLEGFPFSTVS